MKHIALTDSGPALQDAPCPEPGPRQLLVRVHAAGLNRADLLTVEAVKAGSLDPHSALIGRELSGTVIGVGAGVEDFATGDAVMCSAGGALAEYAVVDQDLAMHVPGKALSMEEAAVLPVALNTMHDAVITQGRLRSGQSVLVQGASSGVGLMALQIARYCGAGTVIGTSTTAWRRDRLPEFGADLAVDPTDPGWVDQALDATGGDGVDLVIDQVGPPVANDSMKATALGGRIVNVGRLGGNIGSFDFNLHALRRIAYVGVTFRTRSMKEIRRIGQRMRAALSQALAAGKLKLPVDSRFPLDELDGAFTHMADNRHFGKISVTVE